MTSFEKGFFKFAAMPFNPSTTRSLTRNAFVEKSPFPRGLPQTPKNVSVRQTVKSEKALSPIPSTGKSPFGKMSL